MVQSTWHESRKGKERSRGLTGEDERDKGERDSKKETHMSIDKKHVVQGKNVELYGTTAGESNAAQ